MENGLKRCSSHSEYATEVPVQGVANEALHSPGHYVNCYRVHSHYHQRECPITPSFPVDKCVETSQYQHDPAAAVEGVRRCPYPLDDGTNPRPLQHQSG